VNDAGSDHPQDNEISGSVDHAQAGISAGIPEPSGPFRVDSAEQPSGTHQAKLNLGAVIALGVFGGFVFLAAVITTVVILIRRYIKKKKNASSAILSDDLISIINPSSHESSISDNIS